MSKRGAPQPAQTGPEDCSIEVYRYLVITSSFADNEKDVHVVQRLVKMAFDLRICDNGRAKGHNP